jgi:bifunctional non-homologous end joining protein LigD
MNPWTKEVCMVLPKVRHIIPVEPKENIIPNFSNNNWLYEVKYDGYRAFLRIEGKTAQFISRTHRIMVEYAALAEKIKEELHPLSALLDGEIIVLDPTKAYSDFSRLKEKTAPLVFMAFDLLWWDGLNLLSTPLLQRKRKLEGILKGSHWVQFVPAMSGMTGEKVRDAVTRLGYEGVVIKHAADNYTPSARWYKILNPNYIRPKKNSKRR